MEQVSSLQNPRIKQIRKLRERRAREQSARFVVDAIRDLERALDAGYSVDYALVAPQAGQLPAALLDALSSHNVFQISPDLLGKISYRDNPDPVVAVLKSEVIPGVTDLVQTVPQRLLALVNLQKPGNIGALLRTADAAGMDAVALIDTALDLFNPNIIRASTGACFLRNIYQMTTEQAQQTFHQIGYQVVAASVAGTTDLYDLRLSFPVVIVMGTEDVGLAQSWLNTADVTARIPMAGRLADSLNVSVSGALFMYELLRQRPPARQKF